MNEFKKAEESILFDYREYSNLGYLNDLSTLADNQENFTTEQGLESSKYVFDSIIEHLQYMDLVFFDIDDYKTNCELHDLCDSYKHSKHGILDTMNQLFMMHVDEREYLETMNLLNTQILEMMDLDNERLSRKAKSRMVPAIPLKFSEISVKENTPQIHNNMNRPHSGAMATT